MNSLGMANRLRQVSRLQLAHLNSVAPQNHTLWVVEATKGQDSTDGLPTQTLTVVTQILPTPRVVIGAAEQPGEGGAMIRVGDASVYHLRFDIWPAERLLAAVGFLLDATASDVTLIESGSDPACDLYKILTPSIRETGINTLTMILQRVGTKVAP